MSSQLHLPSMSPQEGKFPERIDCNELLKCAGKRVALDTETTGLRWWDKHFIGVGVWCPDANMSGYIPAYEARERDRIVDTLLKFPPETTVIMHNAKFDLHFLGIDAEKQGWKLIDTTVLVHLEDSRNRKSLDASAKKFLGDDSKQSFRNKVPKKLKNKVWEWPVETIAEYCVNDCRLTYELAQYLVPEIHRLGIWGLFLKDMEYLKLIWQSERRGFLLDVDFLKQALNALLQAREAAIKELHNAVGYEFNWRSPQQLSKALYEDMGWPRPVNPFLDADGVDRTRFASRGKYNSTLTDSFILMEKAKHPLGSLVLHLRETDKLLKTISNPKKDSGYLELMDQDNVIHTNFNVTGTRTARLSSSKPNLQNVASEIRNRETQSVYSGEEAAIRIEEYNLRKAFIARPGYEFVSIDWKQMEMRMFGILAQEPKMLKILEEGGDVHADVAELVWGVRDKVHREWSKTVGFGLIYAMTTGALTLRLDLPQEKATAVAEQYHGTFPRIRPFLKEIMAECGKQNYVRYWSGRYWREEKPIDMYKGANAVIQGGCADILSIAALRCQEYIERGNFDAYILSYVHDEIIFEVSTATSKLIAPPLAQIMEVEDLFDLKFYTDIKYGPSYGELVKPNDPQ